MNKLIMLFFLSGIAWVSYVFYTPFLMLKDMKNAIANNNPAAISVYIDYPALQENIKVQIGGIFKNTYGGVGSPVNVDAQILNRLSGGGMTDRIVKANITPERLARALAQHHKTPEDKRKLFLDEITISSAFASLDEFSAQIKEHRTGHVFKLVMVREGSKWKVVNFIIPNDLIDYAKHNPRVLIAKN